MSTQIYSEEIKRKLLENVATTVIDATHDAVYTYNIHPIEATGAVVSALLSLCVKFKDAKQTRDQIVRALTSERADQIIEQMLKMQSERRKKV